VVILRIGDAAAAEALEGARRAAARLGNEFLDDHEMRRQLDREASPESM
jgi:hypothetical protein